MRIKQHTVAFWYAAVHTLCGCDIDYLADELEAQCIHPEEIIMFYYIVLLLTLSSALSEQELETEIHLSCYSRNLTTSLDDTIHLSGEYHTYTDPPLFSSQLKFICILMQRDCNNC